MESPELLYKKKLAFKIKVVIISTYLLLDTLFNIFVYPLFLDRYMIFYGIKAILSITAIFLFIKITDNWVKGRVFRFAILTIIIFFVVIVVISIIEVTLDYIFNNGFLHKTFTIYYFVLAYAFLLVFLISCILSYFAKKLPYEESVVAFYIPLSLKSISATLFIFTSLVSFFIARGIMLEDNNIIALTEEKLKTDMANINSDILTYLSSLDATIIDNASLISEAYIRYGGVDRNILENIVYPDLELFDIEGASPFTEIIITINTETLNINNSSLMRITSSLDGMRETTYIENSLISKSLGDSSFEKVFRFSNSLIAIKEYNTGEKSFDIVIRRNIVLSGEIIGSIELITSGSHLRNLITRSYSEALWKYILYDINTDTIYDSNDIDIIGSNIALESYVNSIKENYVENENNNTFVNSSIIYIDGEESITVSLLIPSLKSVALYAIPTTTVMKLVPVSSERYSVFIITFIFILLSVVILYFLFLGIARPLKIASIKVEELKVGKRDLRQRINSISNDDIGLLVCEFNDFIGGIDTLIAGLKVKSIDFCNELDNMDYSVKESSNRISEEIENIEASVSSVSNIINSIKSVSRSTDAQSEAFLSATNAISDLLGKIIQVNENMERQSAAVEETSASIEEMISNITSVAKSVNHADNFSKKLLEDARNGCDTVDEVIDAIREIEESSDQIKEIITVIQNIAEQTNLLAMNAAIEAAHAGEQGKGFAVVADEIRSLAEHTASNTKSITMIIKEITKRVDKTVDLAIESGKSLENILDTSGHTAGVISEINTANSELEIGGHDILETVKHLNSITHHVKENAREQLQSRDIVDKQVTLLEQITREVRKSIDANTIGAKDISDAMAFLGDLGEIRRRNNEELSAALDGLKNNFNNFNEVLSSIITEGDIVDIDVDVNVDDNILDDNILDDNILDDSYEDEIIKLLEEDIDNIK